MTVLQEKTCHNVSIEAVDGNEKLGVYDIEFWSVVGSDDFKVNVRYTPDESFMKPPSTIECVSYADRIFNFHEESIWNPEAIELLKTYLRYTPDVFDDPEVTQYVADVLERALENDAQHEEQRAKTRAKIDAAKGDIPEAEKGE